MLFDLYKLLMVALEAAQTTIENTGALPMCIILNFVKMISLAVFCMI